ncbi:hypothetical protein CPHO_11565 [Corynebacterium phocae]|uniref:Aldose epimerase n=1 Tax=Corynebacterium phocae TaxID=161895 RepID=A0A1L7D660_9CORY|nr:hypothetical protein [Corynebacterium phocae]APT93422.1 hypothetical protein CPHO_11565 [Corynebacterium phocae]KAA8721115.1 aldose epimerase [Corynebacterium phocae]
MIDPEGLTISAPGGLTAVISRRGGSVESLTCQGKPLLESNAKDVDARLGAALHLAPWPNRLDAGTFDWQGRTRTMDINEPERNNALHGLVHLKQWDVVAANKEAATVTLGTDIPEWPARIEVTYTLGADGLRVDVEATTTAVSVPFAWGWHPYFSAHGAPVDECTLEIDAKYNLVLDPDRMLPTGDTQPASAVLPQGEIDGAFLDHAFRVAPGTTVRLRNREGHGVALTLSDNLPWVQMYTPDNYPGRGRSIAIEPMSAPPNALATGTDVFTLTPETPFNCHVTISNL